VSAIAVRYHLDEHLPDLDLPLTVGETVTATLPEGGEPWERLAVLYEAVADRVAAAARAGEVTVVASGDCLTALGTMAGLQRAGVADGIVWLDAHGDVQTPETTSSGYLAGMPLRLLAGYRPELIADRLGLSPVPERQILLGGARDLDPPEVAYLQAAEIRQASVPGLTGGGLPDGALYVHIDMDVVAPAEVPGLRFPTPGGGPSVAQLADALRELIDTGRVTGVGVACSWYPGHDAAASLGSHLSAVLEAAG
jgi:arginase